ncbi:MAG: short-chain dehydrogenase/reductase [Acidimicrobiales bacterium]|jgi:NAD(P)-dependent dehydrogenase (short-subunit alcohol dehydrogenase family)|nr:short-chain dehydrogenase/reductase [Acidimicrobiales bacterium]
MNRLCEGRIAIVTGAGRGIGRGHALEFARQGGRVVVNDRGGEVDGRGESDGPAAAVVAEIRELGGDAVANTDDVATWGGARSLVEAALDHFGRLDVLVTNAGIIRDRMLVSLEEEDWDAVIRVHLKGTFAPVHFAAAHWRERAKAGEDVDARIITTTSAAGLYGNPGQTNYSAAKAGILGFTTTAALELARYGVTVNAVAPAGRTRMTEAIFTGKLAKPADGFDFLDADNVAPLVVWLGSLESRDVTGRVFEVAGGAVTVAEGWRRGPSARQKERLDPTAIGSMVGRLLDEAAPLTAAHA